MIPIVVNLDSNDWQLAQKQAAQIGKIKNADAKNSQIVLLCKTLKLALKGVQQ